MLLGAGAIAAVAVTHLVDFGAYHFRYRIFDANSDVSWSHEVVTGTLAVGAAVCLLGARRVHAQRATWIVAAAMLAPLFLVGEASGIHAEIDALSHGRLLYAPILAVLVYCVWRLTRGGAYLAVVRAGGALLLTSYVIHVIEPHRVAEAFGWRAGGWAFQVVVVVKEGLELAGVLVALLALCGAAAAAGQSRPLPVPQVRAREGR